MTLPTPNINEVEENYLLRSDSSFLPDKAIEDHLAELEAWAVDSLAKDQRATARFWLLHGVAFLGAVIAAALGSQGRGALAVVGGAVAALAIAIEAAWCDTGDRHSRRRAIHDVRELEHWVKLRWDKVRLAYPDTAAAKRVVHALTLLDAIQTKRDEISKYLTEPAPHITRSLEM